jgi:hypothetical protein
MLAEIRWIILKWISRLNMEECGKNVETAFNWPGGHSVEPLISFYE